MASSILQRDLKLYIENGLNVLFIGHAGVGKTMSVKEAFEEAGINWKYFSAATMDPWVDFIGVPKEVVNEETGESYLDLIRPKDFQDDKVEAIFFDEFNRAHKKVRNAVMELIQFKSINGRQFKNLRMVWAAINPKGDEDDDEAIIYDVEALDPAQLDRFQIHYNVKYDINPAFFVKKFGKDQAKAIKEWWEDLDPKVQKEVSPRRLEYALDVYNINGDMRKVLPAKSGIDKLLERLTVGSVEEILQEFQKNKDVKAAEIFLADENNYDASIKKIKESRIRRSFFFPLFRKEKIVAQISKDDDFRKELISYLNTKSNDPNIDSDTTFAKYLDIAQEVIRANSNPQLARKLAAKIDNKAMQKGIDPEISKRLLIQEISEINNNLSATGGTTASRTQEVTKLYNTVESKKEEEFINNSSIKMSILDTYSKYVKRTQAASMALNMPLPIMRQYLLIANKFGKSKNESYDLVQDIQASVNSAVLTTIPEVRKKYNSNNEFKAFIDSVLVDKIFRESLGK